MNRPRIDPTDFQSIDASEMDYALTTKRDDPALLERRLRPSRSLSNAGFSNTILFTAAAFCLPLFAFLGTSALWTLLPFTAVAVAALWYFIRRNDRDGELFEHIQLWPNLIAVHRHNPRDKDQYWTANPYWVTVKMRDTKTCENYLTLKGSGREIELGAFLTGDQRINLRNDLESTLAKVRVQNVP